MAEKGWALLVVGKDKEAEDHSQFPFVVLEVVDSNGINEYKFPRRYATNEEALAVAKMLNDSGRSNVIVFKEQAFCVRRTENEPV
jgi:hypothetical protein